MSAAPARLTLVVESADAGATRAFGRSIGRLVSAAQPGHADNGFVLLLTGPLGAGKTVLVQGLAEGLEVTTPVKSPTFALEHRHEGRRPLHHLDLYRLTPGSDLTELGLSELLDGPDVVAIEWPDRLAEPWDARWCVVTIDWPPDAPADSDRRRIRIEGPADQLGRLTSLSDQPTEFHQPTEFR